jgi:alginate O-acetyltransferase complex protein AlgI
MVFSSHLFFYYFLPLALAAYYLLPRRGKHLGLTVLSYGFYGWANPAFMLLMLISTLIDYACGLAIDRRRTEGQGRDRAQRLWLLGSIVSNLSLLGFFKYFNFAVDSYNSFAGMLGLEGARLATTLRVVLPLGISFYTFQSMSYTLDVYRGRTRALRSFIDFACYVSMFPQLVAGPIIRFNEVADQLRERSHTVVKFSRGVVFVCLGMAKKILLANPCGWVADQVFDAGSRQTFDAWVGAVAYGFQIYFDFSGYSDMAIGLGLMLGFVFPRNFASPYRADSITDFWRRWHISLSTWLRDYLYLPLGGNRRGPARTYLNLGLVMLLGGLWHGAAWNFVVWGAFHGAWLALERRLGKRSPYHSLPRPLRVGLTFLGVTVAWVFFRSPDLSAAMAYLGAMIGVGEAQGAAALLAGYLYSPYHAGCLAVAAAVVWGGRESWEWSRRLTWAKGAASFLLLALSLLALAGQGYNPFIYFIF